MQLPKQWQLETDQALIIESWAHTIDPPHATKTLLLPKAMAWADWLLGSAGHIWWAPKHVDVVTTADTAHISQWQAWLFPAGTGASGKDTLPALIFLLKTSRWQHKEIFCSAFGECSVSQVKRQCKELPEALAYLISLPNSYSELGGYQAMLSWYKGVKATQHRVITWKCCALAAPLTPSHAAASPSPSARIVKAIGSFLWPFFLLISFPPVSEHYRLTLSQPAAQSLLVVQDCAPGVHPAGSLPTVPSKAMCKRPLP